MVRDKSNILHSEIRSDFTDPIFRLFSIDIDIIFYACYKLELKDGTEVILKY